MRTTPLKRVSDRRAKQLKLYAKLRKAYLAEHPYCEVWLAEHRTECLKAAEAKGCPRSEDIHHRKGRVGDMLNDTKFWLAVSRQAHEQIHNNPKWAYEKGYLLRK